MTYSDEFIRGATAEARARTEGRTRSGLQVRDYVDAMASHGREAEEIAVSVTIVYGPRDLRGRARLAWRLLRGR